MQRRDCLKLLAGAALLPRLQAFSQTPSQSPVDLHLTPEPAPHYVLTHDDEAFLDDMQRRACLFFVEQASPTTGQVLDRAAANNTTGKLDPRRMASIAATGYGLTALCIADKRKYFPHAQLRDQVLRTLHFHAHKLYNNHGFFYHFNDVETGERIDRNEVSSIDTSLLLCGVLTARAHFSRRPRHLPARLLHLQPRRLALDAQRPQRRQHHLLHGLASRVRLPQRPLEPATASS